MIHQATPIDFNDILSMYASARRFMMEHGNPTQWGTTYPPQETILQDIKQGILFVLEDEEGLYGVFALIAGEDPTYQTIQNGSWISDLPYATLHRIASNQRRKGVFNECLKYARSRYHHLRIDTHEQNLIMRRLILNAGFSYRGKIQVKDGSPRLAYEWISPSL